MAECSACGSLEMVVPGSISATTGWDFSVTAEWCNITHHPWIATDLPRELVGAHVHRVDPLGAPLQQTVGESTGRGPDVEADLALRRHREGGERQADGEPAKPHGQPKYMVKGPADAAGAAFMVLHLCGQEGNPK